MKRIRTLPSAMMVILSIMILLSGCFSEKPPYGDYADGTYIGEASGYRKHLKVQVTLEGGYITAVDVIEHYEKGAEHYQDAMEQVPAAIVKTQTIGVDAVSGATLTSKGIMDAVRAALEQAKP
jgi:uncharacterized protein with FMN-binding domain